MKKRTLYTAGGVIAALCVIIMCASVYMLGYSLTPSPDRQNVDRAYERLFERVPDMRQWVDSLKNNNLLRDTFIDAADGRRLHALYLRCDTAHGRTAVLVHGYKDTAVKFLHFGRMYHRDLGCNILMPDLSAHGLSDGMAIQMGWKDRTDVIRWTEVADKLFRDSTGKTRMVVHGVSMGAATTMCVSGEVLPEYVRCFVEDCGYTSVWDEFAVQLKEQFGLPELPLMYTTSLLCRVRYGWSFGEASPLAQVAKCRRPMLFIHGDKDTFVPTWMVYPLYKAKSGAKELWIARGSEHAAAFTDHPDEYRRRIGAFVNKYMGE